MSNKKCIWCRDTFASIAAKANQGKPEDPIWQALHQGYCLNNPNNASEAVEDTQEAPDQNKGKNKNQPNAADGESSKSEKPVKQRSLEVKKPNALPKFTDEVTAYSSRDELKGDAKSAVDDIRTSWQDEHRLNGVMAKYRKYFGIDPLYLLKRDNPKKDHKPSELWYHYGDETQLPMAAWRKISDAAVQRRNLKHLNYRVTVPKYVSVQNKSYRDAQQKAYNESLAPHASSGTDGSTLQISNAGEEDADEESDEESDEDGDTDKVTEGQTPIKPEKSE